MCVMVGPCGGPGNTCLRFSLRPIEFGHLYCHAKSQELLLRVCSWHGSVWLDKVVRRAGYCRSLIIPTIFITLQNLINFDFESGVVMEELILYKALEKSWIWTQIFLTVEFSNLFCIPCNMLITSNIETRANMDGCVFRRSPAECSVLPTFDLLYNQ